MSWPFPSPGSPNRPFVSCSALTNATSACARPVCPSLTSSFAHTSLAGLSTCHVPSVPFPEQLPLSPFPSALSLPAAVTFQAHVVLCALQKHASLHVLAQPLINFWPLLSPPPAPGRNNGRVLRLGLVTRAGDCQGTVLQLWLHLHESTLRAAAAVFFLFAFVF